MHASHSKRFGGGGGGTKMLSDSSIRYQASITESDQGLGGGVGGRNYSFQALGNVASVMPTPEGLEPTASPS